MKHLLLTAATLLLMQGVNADEGEVAASPCLKTKPSSCSPCVKKDPCCDKPCPPVCFEKGYPTTAACTPNAYNTPASIDAGWDLFFTFNFTYWQAMQGGMDIALPAQATATAPVTGFTQSALGNSVIVQDFEFKPGFQIGFGWNGAKDDWALYGEYTWMRGTTNTTATPPVPSASSANGVSIGTTGVLMPTSWLSGLYTNNATTNITSEWEYTFDILDFQLSRPFYSGARFTLEPFYGVRALWISQEMNLTATVLNVTGQTATTSPRSASYDSDSWALGPRVGFNGNWHLGYGIRFIGDTSLSLLFTRYTEVSQNVGNPETALPPSVIEYDNFDGLRPNLDLSLGFGWGRYLDCRRFHIDLAATYDFSIFWEQNMMRSLADLTANTTGHPGAAAGNLYLQGLTIKTNFEF